MSVTITRPGKVLFPDGLTRAGLATYYERVADVMLPHARGRPVHMQRLPDGIDGPELQQKQAPDHFPDFVDRVEVPRKRGGTVTHAPIESADTRLDGPDQLIFDLDPPGGDLGPARAAARHLRALLEEAKLTPFLKTTGSRGYHVAAPLDRSRGFAEVRAFARELATELADRNPGRFTVEQRIAARGGRLYLDTARTGYAQTAVAPYAVRAIDGAPVACPLEWDELGRVDPQRFTVRNLFRASPAGPTRGRACPGRRRRFPGNRGQAPPGGARPRPLGQ